MTSKGFFITFEGIDGTGKSTQIQMLDWALRTVGCQVFLTKEPGDRTAGSNIGAAIRELLFHNPTTLKMEPGVADLLLLADHIQTSADCGRAKSEGKIVLADRYADSKFAYAAAPKMRCPQWAFDLYASNYGTVPDLTILLLARGPVDLETHVEDISWTLSRATARPGVEAGKQDGKAWGNDVGELRRIQDGYLLHTGTQERTFIVDITEDDDVWAVHARIMTEVRRRMSLST